MAINLYEAMFVLDSAKGGSEFPGVVRYIADLLARHGAQIERIEKWDERKFAYPIKQVKRGIYLLVYFRAEGSAISEIRRMAYLSEQVLRTMILRAEKMSEAQGALYSAEGVEMAPAKPAAPRPVVESAPPVPQAQGEEAPATAPADEKDEPDEASDELEEDEEDQ